MLTNRAGMVSPVAMSVQVCAGSDCTGTVGWKSSLRVSCGMGVGVGAGAAVGVLLVRTAGAWPADPDGAHAAATSARAASSAARRGIIPPAAYSSRTSWATPGDGRRPSPTYGGVLAASPGREGLD